MCLTLSAAEVTIFGQSAKDFISENSTLITITPGPQKITMFNISKAGIVCEFGEFSNTLNSSDCVKTTITNNPPRLTAGSITINTSSAELAGSIVGKNEIFLSAENFSFQPLTAFGTNGKFILNFTRPCSLITSVTLAPSNIRTTFDDEALAIRSVWGNFTDEPSSEGQTIHILGYPEISIQFNRAAIAELLLLK